MAVTNHPLASAAAVEAVAAGGNAVDAAAAALFTLYVVEPMNVGLLGGGTTHVRTPEGRHVVLDGLCTAPAAARADMFEPLPVEKFSFTDVKDRRNSVGAEACAVPGNLAMLCDAVSRFARLPLPALVEPAIRHAFNGFDVTPYLASSIAGGAADIARDGPIASLLMPEDRPLRAGERLVQGALAETLRAVAHEGAAALHEGDIGRRLSDHLANVGGRVTLEDLRGYRVVERDAVRGTYRGHEVFGPPPPASSGVHIVQMLNILEEFDVARLGFGTPDSLHLIAEVLKLAFADRSAVMADPAFAEVPVERLISKEYAGQRRLDLDTGRARRWTAGFGQTEGTNTTHVTVADVDGWIVSATHTIGPGLFGARVLVPELGLIANDYMSDFDPRPGRAHSIAPGKRLTSSQSPMMLVKDGRPRYALGLPGGLRIFGSAMQAIVNLIDHGMSLQEAVEAPRVWTQGHELEVEPAFPADVVAELADRGHEVLRVPVVAGGMSAVSLSSPGRIEGAACWRADGTPAGLGGGLARHDLRREMSAAGRDHPEPVSAGREEATTAAVDLLVLDSTHATVVTELECAFRLHHLWAAPDPDRLLETVAPAVRGLVVDGGSVDDALLGRFPGLELVASYGVGYDGIDAVAAARRGVAVTNTPGVLDDEVADVCVGLLLATIRELPQADRYLRAGKWSTGPYRLTSTLRGRTVGIFGLGRIGRAVARRLEAFGVELCYSGRTRQPGVPYEYIPGIVELARRADTLICAVPGGSETRHAVNAEVMSALGPEGILVNIGRGATVDERALVAALESGTIRAAGLDVFQNEPDVPEQLMRMENVVLLPHVGTGSFDTREAMARLVVTNVVDWFAGRGPRTPVPETSGIGRRLTTASEEQL